MLFRSLLSERGIFRLQRGDVGELAAYAGQHPDQCRQTDADPDTGCMEFEIHKGRFSFRLTAPYSEERRNAASKAAKKHSGNLTHPIQKDVL